MAAPRRQPRRTGGRLRPLTHADRARKQARNERRGRERRQPVPAGQQLVALKRPPRLRARREQIAADAVNPFAPTRALLAFVGRKRKGPRRAS